MKCLQIIAIITCLVSILLLGVLYIGCRKVFNAEYVKIEKHRGSCVKLLGTAVCDKSDLEMATADVNGCEPCRDELASGTVSEMAMWRTIQVYKLCSGTECVKWGQTMGSHVVTFVYIICGIVSLAIGMVIVCVLKMGSRSVYSNSLSLPTLRQPDHSFRGNGPRIVEMNGRENRMLTLEQ